MAKAYLKCMKRPPSLHVFEFFFFYMLQLCNPLPELSARAFIARLLTGRAVRSGSPICGRVLFTDPIDLMDYRQICFALHGHSKKTSFPRSHCAEQHHVTTGLSFGEMKLCRGHSAPNIFGSPARVFFFCAGAILCPTVSEVR